MLQHQSQYHLFHFFYFLDPYKLVDHVMFLSVQKFKLEIPSQA